MKIALFSLLFALSSSAFAVDTLCVVKQKNAASLELAQKLIVPVQNVEVTGFEYGLWTSAVGNNTGSDKVTVRAGNRIDRGMTELTYTVYASQIDDSADCDITDVVIE